MPLALLGFALLHLGSATHAFTCEWYADTLEPIYQCGPKGYPLNYAKKYCERISRIETLSPAGQAWRQATGECLQAALIPVLSQPLSDCRTLRRFAYHTHLDCYTRNGAVSVCDLPNSDIVRVARSLDLGTLVSTKSLGLMLGIARECQRAHRSRSPRSSLDLL